MLKSVFSLSCQCVLMMGVFVRPPTLGVSWRTLYVGTHLETGWKERGRGRARARGKIGRERGQNRVRSR